MRPSDSRRPHGPHASFRRAARILVPAFGWALALLLALSAGPALAAEAPAGDAAVAFARGVLAFHDGEHEAARGHFERAAELAPDDGAVRYWLGLTHLALGRPDDAAREIRRALDAPAGAFDPEEARQRLAEAERRAAAGETAAAAVAAPVWSGDFRVLPELPRFDGRLALAYGTDSNPNLLPDDLTLVTPDGDLVEGEEEDTFGLASLRLGLQSTDAAERRTVGLVVEGSQSFYDQFGYLDFGRAAVTAQVAWGQDPSGFVSGPLGYSRTPLGRTPVTFLVQVGVARDLQDGDALADTLAGGATLGVREGGWGQTELHASYRDVDFDADDPEPLARSGETVRGEVVQYFYFGRRNRYLRLAAAVAERDAGAAFDAESTEGEAELSLPLAPRWTLYLAGSRRQDDYQQAASNLFTGVGDPREDEITRYGASLAWRALDALVLSARVSAIDHEIVTDRGVFGVPDLSYDRRVATVGLTWFFGSGE